MSRAVIGAVAAAFIVALTAAAYFVTTSSLEGRIREDVRVRVAKAAELLVQNASLEALGLLKRAEFVAAEPGFVQALRAADGPDPEIAESAFKKFRASLAAGEAKPDLLSLVDSQGRLVALVSGNKPVVNPIPDTYLKDGKPKYRAISLALENRQITSEVWDYENQGPMKAAVAPVVDTNMNEVVGALVMAYSLTAVEAQSQQKLLGADVAYFYGDQVTATSFAREGGDQTERASQLKKPLFEGGLAKGALDSQAGLADLTTIDIGGEEYFATAGRLPRFSTKALPDDYPAVAAGALVAMSITEAMAPIGTVKIAILVLGLGALVITLLTMFITARRILGPLDEIEVGVNEIINGNIDRTFRPVGSDLDGLANALNVMLSRLLGRPEPGEEEFDDEGNIIQRGTVDFDTEGLSPKDAEAMALAQEPEESYFQRTFGEYVQARKAAGESVDGITLESFKFKLRDNEGKLKSKYQCKMVRFKVVTKDGKVILKPVPIH